MLLCALIKNVHSLRKYKQKWKKRNSMSDELKDMLERAIWTFLESFIGALTISPLVGVDANSLQIAAIAGGGAALSVIKTFAKKKIS